MGVNKIYILGNVGREPELRQAGETTVANFSVAVNDRRFKDKEGNPRTEWFNVVAWGKLAEICGRYLSKGKQVHIEGRVQTRTWENDEGVRQYKTEVVAEQMEMLGGNDKSDDPGF